MSCKPAHASAGQARLWAAEEVSYGVYESVFVNPVRIPVTTESLREARAAGEAYHTIEGGRAPAGSHALGRAAIEGEIVTEFCCNGWGPLLIKHGIGAEYHSVVGESANTREHHGNSSDLPVGLSLVKAIAYRNGGMLVETYLGCRVDALTLRFVHGRNVELRAQVIGRERVTDIAAVEDERYERGDLSMPSRAFSVSLARNGYDLEAAGNIISAEFTVQNGLGASRYEIEGAGLRSAVPEGRRIINGRMEALFSQADEALIESWLADRAVAIRIGGSHAAAGDGVFAEFSFPGARIRGTPTPQIAGRGLIRLDFTWQSLIHQGEPELEWTIANNETEISTGIVARL